MFGIKRRAYLNEVRICDIESRIAHLEERLPRETKDMERRIIDNVYHILDGRGFGVPEQDSPMLKTDEEKRLESIICVLRAKLDREESCRRRAERQADGLVRALSLPESTYNGGICGCASVSKTKESGSTPDRCAKPALENVLGKLREIEKSEFWKTRQDDFAVAGVSAEEDLTIGDLRRWVESEKGGGT